MSDTEEKDEAAAVEALQDAAPAEPECDQRRGHVGARILLGLCALFLAVHLWALGHAVIPVRGTLNMIDRPAGTELRREWVRLDDISPHLVRAVIAAEDTRFCLHEGIDMEAVREALDDRARGSNRGGSTITQQTAKNVFFWNGGGYVRKAGEAWMASFIDTVWTKRRIMEVYLNVAEWGDGAFGAQAAAQMRFSKDARDLSAYESALLASVLPNPQKWRVDPPGPYVSERVGTVQARAAVVRRDGLDRCVLTRP